jgi:pyruvate dehydrogenase E1 component
MQRVRSATVLGNSARMQWLCAAALVDFALAAAALLEHVHGIGVDLWRVDDWGALAEEGVACERQWLQGDRARIDSLVERQLSPTHGPILAIALGERATPETLRAFVPPQRRYLSLGLSAPDTQALLKASVRLLDATGGDWAPVGVT